MQITLKLSETRAIFIKEMLELFIDEKDTSVLELSQEDKNELSDIILDIKQAIIKSKTKICKKV